MALVTQAKVVGALPSTLQADTIYYVKTGSGFDTYITNHSGTIVPYKGNSSAGGTANLKGTRIARRAYDTSGLTEPTIWFETDTKQTIIFYPGDKWRTATGGDVDAAPVPPPPPDPGVY